ncbi:AI-2E family transporter [Tautonia marina]|uniref:AI-2E family transporter n=1 Tax=Tautonia marina TaxID=2653855 RepID=UPI0013756B18|nr:AI-2E family transporter [Tautonia marina]
MPRSTADSPPQTPQVQLDREAWVRTVALAVIAAVLVLAASTQMTGLIIPLILALVFAIALHPIAHWIERRGLGRGVASILCTAIIALVFLAAIGLVVAQAGQVVQNSDRYFEQFSRLASKATDTLRDIPALGALTEPEVMTGGAADEASGEAASRDESTRPPADSERATNSGSTESSGSESGAQITSQHYWTQKIRENAGAIGQWLLHSVGGVLGVLGQVVVFLFLILYILYTRGIWSDRIIQAGRALGMDLQAKDLERMGQSISGWVGCVLLVATGYAVTITLVSWLIGLPQWGLWGLMTGLLVLVPYFGALIAGTMLVIVAAITSQALWPPLVMLGVYILLQTLESYVILPMLYGDAISIDPLAVLVGVLFFGFLWGPLGFVTALPVMVLIRGFVEATPGSTPIKALFGTDGRNS